MNTIPEDLQEDSIHESKNYGYFKIIKYCGAFKIDVQFLVTGFTTTTQSSHIRRGLVKDKLFPKYYGKGYIGNGDYGVNHRAKSVWKSMIERCYSDRCLCYKNYGAKGVTVCDSWLNFQTFAKWYDDNYIEDFHIDKDINSAGSKIYSPSTCVFVSQTENNQEAKGTLGETYTLENLEGEVFTFKDQSVFAKTHKLDTGSLSKVIRGIRKSHKGFRLPSST